MEKIKCFGFDMDYTLAGKCRDLSVGCLVQRWLGLVLSVLIGQFDT